MTGRLAFVFSAALVSACGSPSGTISVTLGGESDAGVLTGVNSLELDEVDQTGHRQTLKTATLPNTDIDLGDVSQDLVVSLELTGSDTAGNALVFGATPFLELGALSGATVPLFVQRKGELARMPGAIADDRTAPLLAASSRGIYYVGGSVSAATGQPPLGGYDSLFLDRFATTCEVVSSPKSFALIQLAQQTSDGDYAIAALLDDTGLYEIGLPGCTNGNPITTFLNEPASWSWSALAGAANVMGSDGAAYFIGASKIDAPSNEVLVLPKSGSGESSTTALRQGAAVAWAPGRGVVVYGGSATEVGAEILTSATAPATQPLSAIPSDATMGLAAITFDGASKMLLAGDAGAPRVVDLSCTKDCTPTAWGQPLGVTLASPSLFALGNTVFMLVGDDPTGATRVFRLDGATPQEKLLKIPRHGARATQTASGAVIIVGGGSATPESYVE